MSSSAVASRARRDPWQPRKETAPAHTLIIAHPGVAKPDPSRPSHSATRDDFLAAGFWADGWEFDIVTTAHGLTVSRPTEDRYGLVVRLGERSLSTVTRERIATATGSAPLSIEEVLDLTTGLAKVAELKDPRAVASFVHALHRHGSDPPEVLAISFDRQAARDAGGFGLRTGLLLGRPVSPAAVVSDLLPRWPLMETRADFAVVHARLHAVGVVASCGRPALVWAASSDRALRRALRDPRVTAVITDQPRRATEIRAALAADWR